MNATSVKSDVSLLLATIDEHFHFVEAISKFWVRDPKFARQVKIFEEEWGDFAAMPKLYIESLKELFCNQIADLGLKCCKQRVYQLLLKRPYLPATVTKQIPRKMEKRPNSSTNH